MKEYHKIDSVYKRDTKGKFLIGEFSRPEFEYLKDLPWLWTEKVDGTNIRVNWDDNRPDMEASNVMFGGKTNNAQIPAKLVQYLREVFHEDRFFDAGFGNTSMTLYGEGYGAGIQNGGNYSPNQKFILFDVKIGDFWLERENVEDIARKLNIDVVPLGTDDTLADMIYRVQTVMLLNWEIPKSGINSNAKIEGWVGTPLIPLFARNGDRIITKVKYKDFK